jgi:hypothetical protein
LTRGLKCLYPCQRFGKLECTLHKDVRHAWVIKKAKGTIVSLLQRLYLRRGQLGFATTNARLKSIPNTGSAEAGDVVLARLFMHHVIRMDHRTVVITYSDLRLDGVAHVRTCPYELTTEDVVGDV